MFDSHNSPTMHSIKNFLAEKRKHHPKTAQFKTKFVVFFFFSKTELRRNRKFEQTNHKHRNQKCNKKYSNKQKPKPRWLHR